MNEEDRGARGLNRHKSVDEMSLLSSLGVGIKLIINGWKLAEIDHRLENTFIVILQSSVSPGHQQYARACLWPGQNNDLQVAQYNYLWYVISIQHSDTKIWLNCYQRVTCVFETPTLLDCSTHNEFKVAGNQGKNSGPELEGKLNNEDTQYRIFISIDR